MLLSCPDATAQAKDRQWIPAEVAGVDEKKVVPVP
jgi:hypothetical protein